MFCKKKKKTLKNPDTSLYNYPFANRTDRFKQISRAAGRRACVGPVPCALCKRLSALASICLLLGAPETGKTTAVFTESHPSHPSLQCAHFLIGCAKQNLNCFLTTENLSWFLTSKPCLKNNEICCHALGDSKENQPGFTTCCFVGEASTAARPKCGNAL